MCDAVEAENGHNDVDPGLYDVSPSLHSSGAFCPLYVPSPCFVQIQTALLELSTLLELLEIWEILERLGLLEV